MYKAPVNSKFIGQGTYGCVYKPNVPCSGDKLPPSNDYISKIQRNTSEVENEERLGKIISSKIRDYRVRFAPILESCRINITEIDKREIDKCNIITKDIKKSKDYGLPIITEYRSYKMKNAGKHSLGEYFIHTVNHSPKYLIKRLLTTHIYLLKSINRLIGLKEYPIVHYDLKENNIIYNQSRKCPIIIDFGLSFEMKESQPFSKEVAMDKYYVYYDKYPPWCIEIVLLSYISQEFIGRDSGDIKSTIHPGDIQKMIQIVDNFIIKSDILKMGISTEEKRDFKDGWVSFLQRFTEKTWEELYYELQNSYVSWDSYSISVMYFFMIHDILYDNNIKSRLLTQYENFLKKSILAIPGPNQRTMRPFINGMVKELRQISRNIKVDEYQSIVKGISGISHAKQQYTLQKIKQRSILEGTY